MDNTYRTIWYNFTLFTILWVSLAHYEEIRAYFDVHPLPVLLDEMGIEELREYESGTDLPNYAAPQVIHPNFDGKVYFTGISKLSGKYSFFFDPVIARVCIDSEGQYAGHKLLNPAKTPFFNQIIEDAILDLYFILGIKGNEYVAGCVTITFLSQ